VLIFREREGMTFVVRREDAESAGLPSQCPSRLITLTVHSSLEAVGFLAAVTGPPGRSWHQRECRIGLLPRSSVCAGTPGG